MIRKGIILAGGSGTRLMPVTQVISKHLLPIFDKPMIYYPLSTLMLSGIREILLISSPDHLYLYQSLLGTGEQWGIHLSYLVQPNPGGIAQAFSIAQDFIEHSHCALILGDNVFYGHDLHHLYHKAMNQEYGATIFAYHVNDPERYGVVEFDSEYKARSLEEKPKEPRSKYAITGLYFYDQNALSLAQKLIPSARGELEITDLNRMYLERNQLNVQILGRGHTWLDTGTHQSLLEASMFVSTIQSRQGLKIACLEEIAYRNHWIDREDLKKLAEKLIHHEYGKYLMSLISINSLN